MPIRRLGNPTSAVLFLLFSGALSQVASQAMNTWTDVTPPGVDKLTDYGTESIAVDPTKPSDIYTMFMSQGVYKSIDYGKTWFGPINTGVNGSKMPGGGGLSIASNGLGKPPIIYVASIRDPGTGFWRSMNGGVDWEHYNIDPAPPGRQDVYPPAVDPYDSKHLLVAGHEYDGLFESFNGGETWSKVTLNGGMSSKGGTSWIFFINTGNAATTGRAFLFIAQQNAGTWRTSDGGAAWTKVDNNCHLHGTSQIYQVGNGVIYMAGVYSVLGWGVIRSADYGQTWERHVGMTGQQNCAFGTPNRVYSLNGWACKNCDIDPSFQSAPQPGISGWVSHQTPAGMRNGGTAAVAVTYDGSHYIFVAAQWLSGIWRYVEDPTTSAGIIKSNKSAPYAHKGKAYGFVAGPEKIKVGENVSVYDINAKRIHIDKAAKQIVIVKER
jgi:hypothetical protein